MKNKIETNERPIWFLHLIITLLLMSFLIGLINEILIGPNAWIAVYITDEVFKIQPFHYVFFFIGSGSHGCEIYTYFSGLTIFGWFAIIAPIIYISYFYYRIIRIRE